MIPLSLFLVLWLVLMAVYAAMTMLTVMLTLRYALSSFGTYAMTAGLLLVIAFVLFITAGYLLTVDWSQEMELFASADRILNF